MPPSIFHARLRALESKLDGVVHRVPHFLLQGLDFHVPKMPFVQHVLGQASDVVVADLGEFRGRGILEFQILGRDRKWVIA